MDGWIDDRICPILEKSRAKEKGPCWSCQLSRPALPRLCCAVACRSVGLGNLVPVRASPNPGSPQMTGPALSSAGPDTVVVASFFAEPVFH